MKNGRIDFLIFHKVTATNGLEIDQHGQNAREVSEFFAEFTLA